MENTSLIRVGFSGSATALSKFIRAAQVAHEDFEGVLTESKLVQGDRCYYLIWQSDNVGHYSRLWHDEVDDLDVYARLYLFGWRLNDEYLKKERAGLDELHGVHLWATAAQPAAESDFNAFGGDLKRRSDIGYLKTSFASLDPCVELAMAELTLSKPLDTKFETLKVAIRQKAVAHLALGNTEDQLIDASE